MGIKCQLCAKHAATKFCKSCPSDAKKLCEHCSLSVHSHIEHAVKPLCCDCFGAGSRVSCNVCQGALCAECSGRWVLLAEQLGMHAAMSVACMMLSRYCSASSPFCICILCPICAFGNVTTTIAVYLFIAAEPQPGLHGESVQLLHSFSV